MMNDVETNSLKADRFFVGAPQPEQVMNPEASASPARIPRVQPSRHGYPMELQIWVRVISKKSLNSILVVRMRQNPNLMLLRKL